MNTIEHSNYPHILAQDNSDQPSLFVLLVENSLPDIELTYEVLEEAEFNVRLQVAKDGVEALEYLDKHRDQLPKLILLDLNLPRLNGLELLKKLKQDKELKAIPVIILSTSDAINDINQSYQNGCNCFITKPSSFHEYVNVMRSINTFWGSVVQMPT